MTYIRLIFFYLGLEARQSRDDIFISQEGYAKEVLKKFRMLDCNPMNTLMEYGLKLSNFEDGNNENHINFKTLVGILR